MKTEGSKETGIPAGQVETEQAAQLLVSFFQLLGARSGMLLNSAQQVALAQVAQLTVDAAVARVEAELLGPEFDKMIEGMIDERIAAAKKVAK